MCNYPTKGQKLFIEDGKATELAHIGQGDINSQFYDYIIGYLNAGNVLIENTINSKWCKGEKYDVKTYEFLMNEELKQCAVAACFLYRQYLELTLKDIYLQYSEDSDSQKEEMIRKTSHNLVKILEYAKPIIESVVAADEKEALEAFEDYVNQFANEDFTSYGFRYPIDKKLMKSIQDERTINLRVLRDRMDEIECFISSGVVSALDIKKITRSSSVYNPSIG